MNGYLACILNDESAHSLKSYAQYNEVFCHHVTIAFKPSKETYKKYEHLIGEQLQGKVTAICMDDKAQAAIVEGIPSENEFPHVTISCKKGVPPAYSNELLSKGEYQKEEVDLEIGGEVRFVEWK